MTLRSTPRWATVAIVGDLDRTQAEELADLITAELPSAGPAPSLPAVPALDQASLAEITFPSSQTHIYVGQPGMRRGDPDYFPLYVGNHILGGGGLVSRLFREVREERGLSYSVNSRFSPMAQDGPYIFSLQTRNDQTGEALQVLRDTLRDFHDKGPTDDELVAAKKNITGGFPLRIDSNSKIVEYLAMIGFYDLPLDYLETFNERVMAMRSIAELGINWLQPIRQFRVATPEALDDRLTQRTQMILERRSPVSAGKKG